MKIILKSIIFLCFTISAVAQNRADIWYFGFEAGLDFNGGDPIALTNGMLSTREGCATICDNNGSLLFYTDGVTVYNSSHSIMQNGLGLEGNISSTHSAIIVPKPKSPNIYYIFTVDDQFGDKGLRYSVVDMSLDGGLGAITTKNILLYNRVPEKVVAYKKSNSEEFWVVSQKYNSNEFIAYEIKASGINVTPVISAVGVANGPERRLSSQIKISPDGSKLALANGWEAQVFNFDENTGKISEPITLLQNVNSYGIEFSPNSSLLYVAYYQGVSQFDLTAGNEEDIEASRVELISSGDSFGSLQLGPNDKIYGTRVNGEYLSVINNPNKIGLECDYFNNGVYLEGKRSYLGLPTFISNIFSLEGGIVFENTCLGESTKFRFKDTVDSMVWDFGDPSSGAKNTSTDRNPIHVFSKEGTYNVSVTVTYGTQVETFSAQVIISAPPVLSNLPTLFACEDSDTPGFSSNFDTSGIENQIAANQDNVLIEYFDGNGNKLPSPLPNPMTNSTKDLQQITARAYFSNNYQCYSESTFELVVQSLPVLENFDDLYSCDEGNGFSSFNLTSIQSSVGVDGDLEFYDSNYNLIGNSSLSNYQNIVPNLDVIYMKLTYKSTGCYSEKSVNLIVNPIPVVNDIGDLIGCDDNRDGISEYFDTSQIESTALGNQTGMEVSYYSESGDLLPSPLPNPYTNTKANKETITIRVTNPQNGCYSESTLNLETSSQPQINKPSNLYACDNGNGIANFDTSTIENQLIGDQTGLNIFYYDEDENQLPSPLPLNFENTKAWSQTISIRVENEFNSYCYSETSFEMVVNELPEINLESNYFLCDLEPSLYIAETSHFNSWLWTYEDGSVISNSFEANLTDAGTYTLRVSSIQNGIPCENSFSFNLVRSVLPVIEEVKIKDISTNNSIEVLTSEDGDFEYSIDGKYFQQENVFHNLSGGVYHVQVRDKNGCGSDEKEVILIDYPEILTPNNDGYNDLWQIEGVHKFPDSKIFIFDRYGKLLKELSSNSRGWDGSYNGRQMPSNDYWFVVNLSDGRTFKGHFSLVRG